MKTQPLSLFYVYEAALNFSKNNDIEFNNENLDEYAFNVLDLDLAEEQLSLILDCHNDFMQHANGSNDHYHGHYHMIESKLLANAGAQTQTPQEEKIMETQTPQEEKIMETQTLSLFYVYEAAWENAKNNGIEFKTEYLAEYAFGALDLELTDEQLSLILDCHAEFMSHGNGSNDHYHMIEAKLRNNA